MEGIVTQNQTIYAMTFKTILNFSGLHWQVHHRCGQHRDRRVRPWSSNGDRGPQALSGVVTKHDFPFCLIYHKQEVKHWQRQMGKNH